MNAEKTYDVAIIGAGPGGYVAGIRAAQLGLVACVIEKDTPGGVCLNWGCIPSKSLIHHASEYLALKHMETLGVVVDRSGFRYGAVQARSREAAAALAGGVAGLLRKNKVEVIKATASIAAPGRIVLNRGEHDGRSLSAKNIIVATGSRPMALPGFEFDEQAVLSSSGLLAMTELPESLVILGAGAIGCEFAYVMNAFGVTVTLVEMASHILPSEDGEAAEVLAASLKRAGIEVRTACRASALRRRQSGIEVEFEQGGKRHKVRADKVLTAFGRTPNTQGIGLEAVGVRTDERGYIPTGDYGETNVKGIFAIGDVTRTPALAHVASREGEIAVEYIAGRHGDTRNIDPSLVPSAVYCEPQLAGFGLREEEAKASGMAYRKSVFPYRGIGKSVAIGRSEGLVKIIADSETGEVLGAHIVGADATELIHELLLARQAELLPEDIHSMIHAHPTLSEAVMEAARGLDGRPIHI